MGPESRADRPKPAFGQEAPAWDFLLTPAESNFIENRLAPFSVSRFKNGAKTCCDAVGGNPAETLQLQRS